MRRTAKRFVPVAVRKFGQEITAANVENRLKRNDEERLLTNVLIAVESWIVGHCDAKTVIHSSKHLCVIFVETELPQRIISVVCVELALSGGHPR